MLLWQKSQVWISRHTFLEVNYIFVCLFQRKVDLRRHRETQHTDLRVLPPPRSTPSSATPTQTSPHLQTTMPISHPAGPELSPPIPIHPSPRPPSFPAALSRPPLHQMLGSPFGLPHPAAISTVAGPLPFSAAAMAAAAAHAAAASHALRRHDEAQTWRWSIWWHDPVAISNEITLL